LNPRPSAWQADVLPLNYARSVKHLKTLGLKYQKTLNPVNKRLADNHLYAATRIISSLTDCVYGKEHTESNDMENNSPYLGIQIEKNGLEKNQ
jgi:hypothetical protein